jgi:hypothetical protein
LGKLHLKDLERSGHRQQVGWETWLCRQVLRHGPQFNLSAFALAASRAFSLRNSQTNSSNPGGFPDTLATFAAIFSQVKFRGLEFFSPQEGPDVDDGVFPRFPKLVRKKFESLNL